MGNRFLHLQVTQRTRQHCFLAHSVLGEVVSQGIGYAYAWEPVPALTGDSAFPAMVFPGSFGPGRGCYLDYSMGNRFLHLQVTLHTRQ